MAVSIGELIGRMGLDTGGLQTSVSRAESAVDRSTNRMSKDIDRFEKRTTKSFNLAKAAITGFVAFLVYRAVRGVISFAKETALLSARYETLGVVLTNVGRNIGRSEEEMHGVADALRETGISAIQSRQSLVRLAQANIDLSNATKLARIAQDAAVIGNINSSEAFGRLVHGIQAAQLEVLRTIGINTNFRNSYKKLADRLGKTTEELTDQEKVQARVNAVMRAGETIAGTYEAAMNTAGKQLTSFARYLQDVKVEFGKAFQPSLIQIISDAKDVIKELSITIKDPQFQASLSALAGGFLRLAQGLATAATYWIKFIRSTTPADVNREKEQAILRQIELVKRFKEISVSENIELTRLTKGVVAEALKAGDTKKALDLLKTQLKGVRDTLKNEMEGMFKPPKIQIPGIEGELGGGEKGGDEDAKYRQALANAAEEERQRREEETNWRIEQAHKENEAIFEIDRRRAENEKALTDDLNEYIRKKREEDFENQRAWNAEKARLEEKYAEKIAAMDEQIADYRLGIAKNLGKGLLALIGASNEQIFLVMKAFDIGVAIISAHAAAAKALAEVPYPWNIAVAAKMKALGYWEAAAIAATAIGQVAMGGVSGGGGGVSTGTYSVSPVTGLPDETGREEMEEQGTTVNIHVHGDYLETNESAQRIAEMLTKYVEDFGGRVVASNAFVAERVE